MIMNAFILIVPIFMIRYLYVAIKAKQKLHRLNYFPTAEGIEKYGKTAYIMVNTFLLFAPLFMRIQGRAGTLFIGGILYLIGLIIYFLSIRDFISGEGLIRNGMYGFCRNPQAISFILVYFGIGVITNSLLYLSLSLFLIWAFNEMAKSEERYCRLEFGESYDSYMEVTKRFI